MSDLASRRGAIENRVRKAMRALLCTLSSTMRTVQGTSPNIAAKLRGLSGPDKCRKY